MINRFQSDTALLLIDVQKGVNDLPHWGGASGRRNNPEAELKMAALLDGWRELAFPIVFTKHNSRQKVSPLKDVLPGGDFIEPLQPLPGELVVSKDVNSAFIGTNLELELRRRAVSRLVVVGFFTNFCVETTVRMAGNMGFDTYLAHDCCATTNRFDLDGRDHDPEDVHRLSVASMHGEFCTALSHDDILGLLTSDANDLVRVQSNE
ncbi:cysteine hydrolase family protein [Rhizobacter sp. Root404]|uniref:cysteine hydrolase family protein n=1 Tax=Rhizobacter sp. Root404 TaxID=1736528 RepID=UPI0006F81E5E|nr:cysteine hydrolase family protein [Rhizobacter sp. Root404]KQW38420.1 isochorismatase [Rhizobacter sp. Root404]